MAVSERAFGGSVDITLTDGTVISGQIAVTEAHQLGVRRFGREHYINRLRTLASGVVEVDETERFPTAV